MSTPLTFLLQLSPFTAMVTGTLLFTGVALMIAFGISLVRAPRWQDAFKGMFPPLCASLMVAYAIFTVIVANTGWRDHEDANRTARVESYALKRLLFHMPQDSEGRAVLRNYVESVIEREWPTMKERRGHPETTRALIELRNWAMSPATPYANTNMNAFYQDAIKDLGAARDHRLTLTRQSIPGVLWFALMLNAAVVLLAVAMAHAHNRRASYIMCGLYGAVMGTILTTMILLDHPYSGPLRVTSYHIQDVLDRF